MTACTSSSPTTTQHPQQTGVQNPLAELCPAQGTKIDGIAHEPGVLKDFKTNYSVTVDGKEYHYRWVPPGPRNPEIFYVPPELLQHVKQVISSTLRQEALQRVEASGIPSKEATSSHDSLLAGEVKAYAFTTWRKNGAPVLFLPIPPAESVSRLFWASTIVHEVTHARGLGEPLAFRQQQDYLSKYGLSIGEFSLHEDGANLTALRWFGYNDVSLLFGLNEIAAERARIDDTPKLKTSSAIELYRTITGQLFRDEEFVLPLALAVLQHRSETGALTDIMRDEPRPSVKQAIDDMRKFCSRDSWKTLRTKFDEQASLVTNRKKGTLP